MREQGLEIGREIAKGESVEHEITAFIEKRHNRRVRDEGDRAAEELWRESERRQEARRRAENLAGWYGWHMAGRASTSGCRGSTRQQRRAC